MSCDHLAELHKEAVHALVGQFTNFKHSDCVVLQTLGGWGRGDVGEGGCGGGGMWGISLIHSRCKSFPNRMGLRTNWREVAHHKECGEGGIK